MRNDFRVFRLDRIERCDALDRTFEQLRGQRLEDFLKRIKAMPEGQNAADMMAQGRA